MSPESKRTARRLKMSAMEIYAATCRRRSSGSVSSEYADMSCCRAVARYPGGNVRAGKRRSGDSVRKGIVVEDR